MRTSVSVDLGRGQGNRMNLKPPGSRILHRDLSPRFSLVSHRSSVKGQPSAVLLLKRACRKVEEQTIMVRRGRISRTSRRQLRDGGSLVKAQSNQTVTIFCRKDCLFMFISDTTSILFYFYSFCRTFFF